MNSDQTGAPEQDKPQEQPDWMPPSPPPAGPARTSGFDRVIKKLDPLIAKTKLDVDACRQVVTKIVADQETKVKNLMKIAAPGEGAGRQAAITKYAKAAPCGASWDEMSGTDSFRLCSDCKLFVYDVRDMTTKEVEELVYQRESRENVRFFKRADGRFLTADCPIGAKRRRNLAIASAVTIALLLSATVAAFNLQRSAPTASEREPAKTFDIDKVVMARSVTAGQEAGASSGSGSGGGASSNLGLGELPSEQDPPDMVFRQPAQPVAPAPPPASLPAPASTPTSSPVSPPPGKTPSADDGFVPDQPVENSSSAK